MGGGDGAARGGGGGSAGSGGGGSAGSGGCTGAGVCGDAGAGAADAAAGASRCKMRIARARSRACARVTRFDRKTILHALYSYGHTRATG